MKFIRHPIAVLLSLGCSGLCWSSPSTIAVAVAAGPQVSVDPQPASLDPNDESFASATGAPLAGASSSPQPLDEQAVLHALFYDVVRPQQLAAQGQWVALDEHRLGQVRGGFITDSGLEISFGIERAVYVNGDLVAATSLNVVDLNNVTLETLRPNGSGGGSGGSSGSGSGGGSGGNGPQAGPTIPVNLVQIGPGNTITPGALANGGLGTVIQNSLNNQAIRSITTIEATVNSLQVLRGMDLLSQIRSSIIDSLPK